MNKKLKSKGLLYTSITIFILMLFCVCVASVDWINVRETALRHWYNSWEIKDRY